jgi:Flp pilus assembly protein TadG
MRLVDRRESGQALAEAALVLPLFFAMFFGILDLGRVIWANDVVANAAREGARFASVNAGYLQIARPVAATTDEIRAHALEFLWAAGVNASVEVCFSTPHVAAQTAGCTGNTNEAGAAYERGNMVTVVVKSHVPVFTGALVGFGEFNVSGQSVVLINN